MFVVFVLLCVWNNVVVVVCVYTAELLYKERCIYCRIVMAKHIIEMADVSTPSSSSIISSSSSIDWCSICNCLVLQLRRWVVVALFLVHRAACYWMLAGCCVFHSFQLCPTSSSYCYRPNSIFSPSHPPYLVPELIICGRLKASNYRQQRCVLPIL